jgi:cation:H+ antiporter
VVDNAVKLAETFGVSSLVIGSTIIAIGTSLPEVAGTIAAVRMRKPDIVFGNIFGSNLFNIGLVGGVAISISPGSILSRIDYQLFMMYFVSFLVIFLSRNVIKRNFVVGYSFIAFYLLFIISLF